MTNEQYEDDKSIPDEAELWRRVPPGINWSVLDENLGRIRPTSQAFRDSPDGSPMSVFLADECGNPQTAIAGHEGFGLVVFSAGLARKCGQKIARKPLPEQPSHAFVVGEKTKPVQNRLARGCRWIIEPST